MPLSLDFEYLLTDQGLQPRQRVSVDDAGLITAIAPSPAQKFEAGLAIPGMPNAHSHAFQRAMVGYGETRRQGDSFWRWREHMYALAEAITPEDLYAIARRAYADMLRAGFTTVGEFHYVHHSVDGRAGPEMADALIRAAGDTGIRLVLLPVYYRLGGFDEPPSPRQRRFIHDSPQAYCRLLESVSGVPCGIAPHSLRAVPVQELNELLAQAATILGEDFPVHLHISEQQAEVEQCIAHHGVRPVEALAGQVGLGPNWNLVHATHANAAERELIVASGARVVLCPLTEAYLGDGQFAGSEYSRIGGQFALGSDSNVRIDAIEELRMLEYGERLRRQSRICLGDGARHGESLWQSVAAAGGAALRLPVGGVSAGQFADFVVLDCDSPRLASVPMERMLDAWLTAGSGADIGVVYTGGTERVRQGQMTGEAEIDDAYQACLRSLQRRLDD